VVAEHDIMRAVFRLEAELTLFLRMHTKEIAKTAKCIPTEQLFSSYRNSGSIKRMARSNFWPEARNYALLHRRSEKQAQNSLIVLSNLHNFSPFMAIAVAERDGIQTSINLILSANCNKTANINVKNLTV